MRASDLMSREVATIELGETVVNAARRMTDLGVGDLVVVESLNGATRPIGIVTDRDLVVRAMVRPQALASLVADVMDTTLVTVGDAAAVEDVLATMRTQGVRRLPVVDAAGDLQGILTLDDIVMWLAERMADVAGLLARQQSDA
jgi:CBS domain-containing protein